MVYIFLAYGFEEIEGLCAVDLLRRAGVAVTTVGVGGKYITGSHNITVEADITEDEAQKLDLNNSEMVVLPGGMPGTNNLESSKTVAKFLEFAKENDKFIAAICAAPSILGKRGYLAGRKATCYPGFEKYLNGAAIQDAGVTVDGRIICGRAMGSAVDFALALICALKGENEAAKIKSSIIS